MSDATIEVRPLLAERSILSDRHPLEAVEYVGTQERLTSLGLAASHWFPQGRKRKTFGFAPVMQGLYGWNIERKGGLYCLRIRIDLTESLSPNLAADVFR